MDRWPVVVLASILVGSLSLNVWNNQFPVGYHGDEPKKVRFLLSGEQDFHLPILILQISRGVNLVLGWEDDRVVLIGRWVSAIVGTLAVFFLFLLARRTLGDRWALLAAAATAVSPMLVIHAHYLKEDVLYTACAFAALRCFVRFAEDPLWRHAWPLGIATGLAFASHWKSALLVPLAVIYPLFAYTPSRARYYKWLLAATGIAGYVFVNVNYPLVEDPKTFFAGIEHEFLHAKTGHSIKVHATVHAFAFHLINSILPGLTIPVAVLGLMGAVALGVQWGRLPNQDRLLLVFALASYIIPEVSPSKPAPDYMRYVMQTSLLLIYFGFRFLKQIWDSESVAGRTLAGVCAAVLVFAPLPATIQYDYYLVEDTRVEAAEWVADSGGKAFFEQYAAAQHDAVCAVDQSIESLQAQGYDYIVASDFRYERYYRGSQLDGQDTWVYQRHQGYEELFQYPYVEIRPTFRSFAFSNPTIRIVDIRKDPEIRTDHEILQRTDGR